MVAVGGMEVVASVSVGKAIAVIGVGVPGLLLVLIVKVDEKTYH
jgi:hypothetical protein